VPRPFELAELLPDVAVAPVRLPRRQAGNSPQDLAVTLLADYSLRTRAWLPSAAIVALLAESGVTAGAARTAISRLARRDVLESSRRGRHTAYRLTGPAAAALASGGTQIAAFTADAESWDGHWTLIAFSVPQDGEARRRLLRGRLRWLGYAPLYDALWISPHKLTEREAGRLADLGAGVLTVFRARTLDLDGVPCRDPLDAWDMPAIGEHYQTFVDRWSPLLSRIHSGQIDGAEAVRARTEVMDSYRRFVVLDPRLPVRLMPANWPRERAREVFATVYDGLAAPALAHVRDVVTRFAPGEWPDIATHTVADLRAGLATHLARPAGPG
jgi:phenylacetic acid degradation operon negative regulatory protein